MFQGRLEVHLYHWLCFSDSLYDLRVFWGLANGKPWKLNTMRFVWIIYDVLLSQLPCFWFPLSYISLVLLKFYAAVWKHCCHVSFPQSNHNHCGQEAFPFTKMEWTCIYGTPYSAEYTIIARSLCWHWPSISVQGGYWARRIGHICFRALIRCPYNYAIGYATIDSWKFDPACSGSEILANLANLR